MTEKLTMHTKDLAQDNVEKIRDLFPNCVTETKDSGGRTVLAVDFEALKRQLSNDLVPDGKERYVFTWPEKAETYLRSNRPATDKFDEKEEYVTLRPKREASVDFDNTENVYIEGDNLNALKLIRETYLGTIKLIYIDPPYNTGSDLLYNDKFVLSEDEYVDSSGDYDSNGNRMVQNLESNGRFHTDWLNMIYSRIALSKDLLSEDGAIFISIDDNEMHNLRKICDELFGSRNYIATIPILSNPRGRQSSSFIAQTHEYGIVYAKNINTCIISGEELTPEQKKEYSYSDARGAYRLLGLRLRGGRATAAESPTLHFPIYYDVTTNDFSVEPKEGYDYQIIPKFENGTLGTWRWSKKKIMEQKDDLLVKQVKDRYDVFQKDYLGPDKRMKLKSLWFEKEINYDNSARELSSLGMADYFPYAKPLYLMKKIIKCFVPDGGIILDYFSGSATTAHAIIELNNESEVKRNFILVQWPEKCDEKSIAYQNGFSNICQIGEERIRRAIKAQSKQLKLDRTVDNGFRVFYIDSSNMKQVYYNPRAYKKDILDYSVDNIKNDRTGEDLLIQVMLELGIELSAKISKCEINGKEVFEVDSNYLVACFDENVTDEVVIEIAKRKPTHVVFRDSSLANDSVAINFEQIFQAYSPNSKPRII